MKTIAAVAAYLVLIAVAVIVIALFVLRPNEMADRFGDDILPGTPESRRVEQDRMLRAAEELAVWMRTEARELRSLKEEQRVLVAGVRRLRSKSSSNRRRIAESGVMEYLETVKDGLDAVTVAEFESRAREIKTLIQKLREEVARVRQREFLQATQANLDKVRQSNQERRKAVEEIRRILPGKKS